MRRDYQGGAAKGGHIRERGEHQEGAAWRGVEGSDDVLAAGCAGLWVPLHPLLLEHCGARPAAQQDPHLHAPGQTGALDWQLCVAAADALPLRRGLAGRTAFASVRA